MFRNYLKTAWRNLNKHKLFSFINIFGLASGMTVCMLALIKIKEAYEYDNFHPESYRSYRVITNSTNKGGDHLLYASSPLPLSDFLKSNYSIIERSTAVHFSHDAIIGNGKELPATEAYAGSDFYKIFGFKLSSGSPATNPQTVVLTRETAQRFFGNADPIGRVITIGSSNNFLVTGILENPSSPSHLKFDVLVSLSSLPMQNNKVSVNWDDEGAAYTYVQLKPGASEASLRAVLKNASKEVNALFLASANVNFLFDVQRLDDISPGSIPLHNLTGEPIVPNLVIFAVIGLAMLLLAFFNYVSLTLARALDRAREVGVRKVAGASRRHVMMQFLSESLLVAIFAFFLACIEVRLVSTLPVVQNLIGNFKYDAQLWLYFIAFTAFTGIFAGWIPARVFATLQPVKVLKGKFNSKLFGGVGLRKALSVIQFAVSLVAIVILFVFYKQSLFMVTADYGFEKREMLNIRLPQNSYQKLAPAFSAVPGVESVSAASALFGFSGGNTKFIKRDRTADSIAGNYFSVSPTFITDTKLQLIAGENLPASSPNNNAHFVLINEKASQALKFKDPGAAVGNTVLLNDTTRCIIAGIVKDFHYASFMTSIQPLLLANQQDEYAVLNLKISPSAAANIIPALEAAWKKLYPHQPFLASWYDKELTHEHLHKDDLVFLGLLTIMALSIACLGLLGIVIYTTKNRAKEVSVRRVMGANVWRVVIEISRGFAGLLLIATCIGLPIGFVIGGEFLRQYAYRISVSVSLLAESAAALFVLGGLTIIWQTYRAANANPVVALRGE
ncbi:MAG TPA: ABC transporter permease [Parafilimonas sp.]|nr:ABC transporter permease [Parafilimonas sp.]